ncbi:MAG: glycoside hydrolase family 15 protein, partial [Pseudomonadota bacterium]
MRSIIRSALAIGGLALAACAGPDVPAPKIAPGAPGDAPTWSNAEKIGIGTAYEAYDADGQYSDKSPTAPISKVWFSVGKDRITEVMWGLIHEAQIREIRYILVGPDGVMIPDRVSAAPMRGDIDGIGHPLPVHMQRLVYDGGDVELRAQAVTDPDNQTLISTFQLMSERDDLRVFAYIDPALANTGTGDRAWVDGTHLYAQDGEAALAIGGLYPLNLARTVGFVGATDLMADVLAGTASESTGDDVGNVEMLVEIPFPDGGLKGGGLYVGFGETADAAKASVDASRAKTVDRLFDDYVDGWLGYLKALEHLPTVRAQAIDDGDLASMSAINLKIMEDKTHAGALIASLSNPWGETAPADQPQTGYKAVWPRDFFQVASAFLALGDADTALAAYRYLPMVQVTDDTPGNSGVTGWFL